MKIRKTKGEALFDIVNTLIMCGIILVTVYPLTHVLFASFSEPNKLMAHTGFLWHPLGFTTAAYELVLKNPNILRGYVNTLIILVGGVALSMVVTLLAAYVLSRKNVRWTTGVMKFIVFTMFFNGGLIPFFLTVKNLHLMDSYLSTMIPFAMSAFNLIILRTSLLQIPDSIEESARIDGAGHMTVLFRIVVPLSLPIIAVIGLYYAVDKWNGWFYASIFIRERSMLPLQVILREILLNNGTDEMLTAVVSGQKQDIGNTLKQAAVIVATLPILVLYPYLQKYFIKGMMVGAVKG